MKAKDIESQILKIYGDRVLVEEITGKKYIIDLPMFLDTGDTVTVFLEHVEKRRYCLSNNLYLSLEVSLERNDLLNSYLLKEDRFKAIKDKFLRENYIMVSEFLEKNFAYQSHEQLTDIIFQYAHFVKVYYNHIYHFITSHQREGDKRNAFARAVAKFIDTYYGNTTKKIEKVEREDFISSSNYYKTKDLAYISTANSKARIGEAIMDFETLKRAGDMKTGMILLEVTSSNNLSQVYVDKVASKLKDFGIDYMIFNNRDNYKSDPYKQLKSYIG
ncbi:hypothetical protein BZG01_00945 [Labilibaculum manganireducens]|uniref:Uncharacterized protein n=1 Tax=Labilibaculum manganireducens TaxID=1940525 RepID=A0A2N3IGV1_9BACT|nr:hypothetical protein [Labilibaculum manganireducens]PKQ69527.1 hypothetical protein BZG01_00945 [Labilibaculum manganireducens]